MKWETIQLDPLTIRLDPENPRLFLPENASQDQVRLELLENEDIIEMAIDIISFGGLMGGERIIVAWFQDSYTVLEGNRRVCAIQLLLNPNLKPSLYKRLLPACPEPIRESLREVRVDIAPSREEAAPTITKKHTESGVKQWSPASKVRRVGRLFAQGKAISDIAELLGGKDSTVRRQIREFVLLEEIKTLPGWSESEIKLLTSNRLKTNPFLRFFTLKDSTETLGIEYSSDQRIQFSKVDSSRRAELLEYLARKLLLAGEQNGRTEFNTRSSTNEVLAQWFGPAWPGHSDSGNESPKSGSEQCEQDEQGHKDVEPTNKKKTLANKEQLFLHGINCSVNDNRLIALLNEAQTIPYRNAPISSIFLLRAILEACLNYLLKRGKLMQQFMDDAKNSNSNVKPGFLGKIRFCIKNKDKVFMDPSAVSTLNYLITSQQKDYMDMVVHDIWTSVTEEDVLKASSKLRGFIKDIAEGNL